MMGPGGALYVQGHSVSWRGAMGPAGAWWFLGAWWVLEGHVGSGMGTVYPGGARYVSMGTVSPGGEHSVLEGNGRWVLEGHGGSWCMVGPGAARWVLERHGGFWRGTVGSGGAWWVL